MMSRIHAEELHIHYGHNKIIKGIDLDIPDKKVTAIIGSNGCGKSTLLKAMTRIIPYQQGAVIFDGKMISRENTKQLARKMAILPQSQESASGLTVRELISYGRFPYQKGMGKMTKRDKEAIQWAMDVTNTHAFQYHPVDALSGGQRQRVWIAMALAQETDIIFLDEPTTYLDMAHQLEVLELLDRLNKEQERTIIMVLHDLNQAARFADYMVALKDGEIIQTGVAGDVMTPEVLKKVFHIDALIGKDPRTGQPICISYNLIKGDQSHEKESDAYPSAVDAVY